MQEQDLGAHTPKQFRPFKYGKIPTTKPMLKGQQWLDSHGQQQLQDSQGKPLEPQSNSLWTLADVELATVELFRQIMSTPPLHTGPEKRTALFKLLRWWSAAHPSGRCRGGAQKLVGGYSSGRCKGGAQKLVGGGDCACERAGRSLTPARCI
eukprot:58185-Pelagomonas_calceolata.AAC.1